MQFIKYKWHEIIFWRSSNKEIQINKKHFISFDIETSLYFNNERIKSEQEFRRLCYSFKKFDDNTKQKFSTFAWCFLCYDDYNGFCAFKSWDDIFTYFEYTQSKIIWDFNLKYDGSYLDYIFYFNPLYSCTDKNKSYYYKNLLNINGQRYNLMIIHNKRTYNIIDFNNILKTSIEQMGRDYNITFNNRIINKKKMDYFKTTWETVTDEELNYCFNDVYILYNVIKLFNNELKIIAPGYSLTGINRYIPLTSSSISKAVLLEYIYKQNDLNKNLKKYNYSHPLTIKQDEFYRENGLYKGGLTFINDKYKGKLLNKKIYVYDVNSEYPFIMSQLNDLEGKPYYYTYEDYLKSSMKKDYVAILFFSELKMEVKKNMIACFFYKGENVNYLNFSSEIERILMFECEYENIKQFYNIISFKIIKCDLYYKGKKIYEEFVNKLYYLRQTTKNITQRNLIKLILNSSYGKLGQKIKVPIMEQYLKNNVVTFKIKKINDEIQYDFCPKNKMSVVNAAYITANARCYIRNKIIEICQPNVRKNFIYCDTDSIHTFAKYNKTSFKLGDLKLEGEGVQGKYLKPKTYVLKIDDNNYKVSSKGINKKSLNGYIDENFIDIFQYEKHFYSLSSILVRGGRALILINKNLGAKE